MTTQTITETKSLATQLNKVEFIKHNTIYKDLSTEELWVIGSTPVWDNPVEALKEVITREIDTYAGLENKIDFTLHLNTGVYYSVALFVYSWIIPNEKFYNQFSPEDIYDAKYTYTHALDCFLDEPAYH